MLDFLVLSDKDEKQYPSHSSFTYLFLWHVKEPTSLFEKSRPQFCGQPTFTGCGIW